MVGWTYMALQSAGCSILHLHIEGSVYADMLKMSFKNVLFLPAQQIHYCLGQASPAV